MDKWEKFKHYNVRDVEVEMGIQKKLARFPVSDAIWDEYHLDQIINDRGIVADMTFVSRVIDFDERIKTSLMEKIQKLTGLENPDTVLQMRGWLSDNGLETESLGKKVVADLIKDTDGDIAKILSLRQKLAKSSVKKYTAIKNSVCKDNRVRGMFMFYEANRTGRFAGR